MYNFCCCWKTVLNIVWIRNKNQIRSNKSLRFHRGMTIPYHFRPTSLLAGEWTVTTVKTPRFLRRGCYTVYLRLTLYCLISEKISLDKTEPGSEQGTAVDTVGNVSRLHTFFHISRSPWLEFRTSLKLVWFSLILNWRIFFFFISRTLALTEWKLIFKQL